jgi:hypothetical protein
MFTDEIISLVAAAIKTEVAHPLVAMRHLPVSEEEVALTILNALNDAGYTIIRREDLPSA